MPYPEFYRLLANIDHKTPLGNIVRIRMEEDPDMLKHFTPDQHKIRNEWRGNHSLIDQMTEEQKAEAVRRFQNYFTKGFS